MTHHLNSIDPSQYFIELAAKKLFDSTYSICERTDAATELLLSASSDDFGLVGVIEAVSLEKLKKVVSGRENPELQFEARRLHLFLDRAINKHAVQDAEIDHSETLTQLNIITEKAGIKSFLFASFENNKSLEIIPLWEWKAGTGGKSFAQLTLTQEIDRNFVKSALLEIGVTAKDMTADIVADAPSYWKLAVYEDQLKKVSAESANFLIEKISSSRTAYFLNRAVDIAELKSSAPEQTDVKWHLLEVGDINTKTYALLQAIPDKAFETYSKALSKAGIVHHNDSDGNGYLKITRDDFLKITPAQTKQVLSGYKVNNAPPQPPVNPLNIAVRQIPNTAHISKPSF